MPYLLPILVKYENRIVFQHIGEPYLASHSTILLSEDKKRLVKEPVSNSIVLIGSFGSIRSALALIPRFQCLSLIITDYTGGPELFDEFLDKADNLICITNSASEVHARFLFCFHQYHIWRYKLNDAFTYAQSDTVLPAISKTAACAVYVYSASEFILMDYCIQAFDNEFTQSVKNSFYMPSFLKKAAEHSHSKFPLFGRFPNHYNYVLHQMTDFKDYRILLLLIYTGKMAIDIPPQDFLYIIAGQWEKHLDFRQNFRHAPPPDACDSLIADLFSNRLTDSYLIDEALHGLKYPVKEVISFIYFQFPELKNFTLHQSILTSELQQIFPNFNIGCYQRCLILVCSVPRSFYGSFLTSEKKAELASWLEKHNSYAAMGPPTRYLEKLNTVLILSQKLCLLGQRITRKAQTRFFSSLTFSSYTAIDLCAKAFQETFGHEDLVYLTHPAICRIRTYDEENKTEYEKVLYQYLYCSCNINRASEALYLHRNTVRNQINRISQLFDLDLEDNRLRANLLFSFQVTAYFEKVLGHSIGPVF